MAGKLHKDYVPYLAGTGQELVPGSKMVKAYAHGYGDQRRGALQASNPYPEPVGGVDNNARAWDQGWRDANAGNPPTHVGGATGVPQVEEEPQGASGGEETRQATRRRQVGELDEALEEQERGVDTPDTRSSRAPRRPARATRYDDEDEED